MASNATVEKLKALGLRHGEKAVVGLAAVLCLLFLFMAFTKKTIDITPDEVKSHATAAKTNIEKKQDPESIVKRLETEYLKTPDFEKQVDKMENTTLDASIYKPVRPWVYAEPGAGLLRDKPVLIAVSELYAYPGRGGFAMYELKEGERVPDDGKSQDEFTKSRRLGKPKKRRSGGMMGGGMGGMMGGMGGGARKKPKKSKSEIEREEKARIAEANKRTQKTLAGANADAEKGKAGEEAAGGAAADAGGPYKETTKGARWIVLTGTLNYKLLRDNYLKALKVPEVAYPHFRAEGGLDLERQVQNDDGTWPSDWELVDRSKNLEILDNLPEEEEELAPDDVLLDPIVDPLPFLKSGYWERVHIASLVPSEKKETKAAPPMGGMMGGMAGGPSMSSMMGRGGASMGGADSMGGGKMMGRGMMGMMGAGGPTSGAPQAEDTSFPHSDADTVMIRALDFTADPEYIYRYRVRLVVYNPNRGREDINPGVDDKSEFILGPWSQPTEPVMMPADITPYAMAKAQATGGNNDEVSFQVTRFIPDEGATVVRTFTASPGELIGEQGSAAIYTEGKPLRNKPVDFTSGDLVLDTAGGPKPLPAGLGATGGAFDVPALALLIRPDGSVMVRTQAFDYYDDVRKDTDNGYKKDINEASSKKGRKNSYGANAGVMGGGMMGMGMMGMPMMGGASTGPGRGTGGASFNVGGGAMRTGQGVGGGQGAGTGR